MPWGDRLARRHLEPAWIIQQDRAVRGRRELSMKRVILFLATNLAVLLVLPATQHLLGFDRVMSERGRDYRAKMAFSLVIGFGGGFIWLLIWKPMAKWPTMPEVAIYEGLRGGARPRDQGRRQRRHGGRRVSSRRAGAGPVAEVVRGFWNQQPARVPGIVLVASAHRGTHRGPRRRAIDCRSRRPIRRTRRRALIRSVAMAGRDFVSTAGTNVCTQQGRSR